MSEVLKKILERLSGARTSVSGTRARDLIEQQQIFDNEVEQQIGQGEPWVAGIHRNRKKPVNLRLQQAVDEGLFPPVD